MTKQQFHEFLAHATKEPHSFACIDEHAWHEALRFRVNWDTPYFPV